MSNFNTYKALSNLDNEASIPYPLNSIKSTIKIINIIFFLF